MQLPEAIIDQAKEKGLHGISRYDARQFLENTIAVLKPGRWMTVVFHNSQATRFGMLSKRAMSSAGFVVADDANT